jgi:hypothetical protein
MKVTPRFWLRAGLVLCAAGALGAFGACSKDNNPVAPPPPPPPPPPLTPPSNVTATVASQTKINVAWAETDTTVTGFQLDRCSGPSCTTFAHLAVTAKNVVTYGDTGLTANTFYSYRVRAFTAKDTTGGAGGTSFTMVGAGEIISTCPNSTGTVGTARVVDSILKMDTSTIAFVAGDAQADTGVSGMKFEDCYAKSAWGAFKDRTYFAIGNGDYAGGRGETDIFGYMGSRTGPQTQGFGSFSVDKGNWHLVFINTADWQQSNAELQSPTGKMNTWLAADLAAVPTTKCIAVFSWDRRIYTTGTGTLGTQFNVKQAAIILQQYGADLLISSKDKVYARFPQTDANGTPNPAGFTQFIVGTGGRSLDQMITPAAGNPVEKQNGGPSGSWGVLKLTLDQNSYSYQFIPTRADGFTDSGGPVPCHN